LRAPIAKRRTPNRKGPTSVGPINSNREAITALPEAGAKPEGREATDLIAFVFAVYFFLQKQPKNRVSSPKTT